MTQDRNHKDGTREASRGGERSLSRGARHTSGPSGLGCGPYGRVIPETSPPTSLMLSYRVWTMYSPLWANPPGSFVAY